MTPEEKMLHLFELEHGEMTGSCISKVVVNGSGDPIGVDVIKDGNLCWHASREALMFAYVTRHLK